MISREHTCLFVHIPKFAGASIEAAPHMTEPAQGLVGSVYAEDIHLLNDAFE